MAHSIPAMEAPQNISLYSKEPRRIGHHTVMTSSAPPLPPPHKQLMKPTSSMSTLQTKSQMTPPKQKIEVNNTTDQFVPWPSIEEVKAKRAHLLHKSQQPTPTLKHQEPFRGRSQSPIRIKPKDRTESPVNKNLALNLPTQHFQEESTSAMHPRRFRISISPTRKLQTETFGDTDSTRPPAPTRPRYIIKQRIIPGSTIR